MSSAKELLRRAEFGAPQHDADHLSCDDGGAVLTAPQGDTARLQALSREIAAEPSNAAQTDNEPAAGALLRRAPELTREAILEVYETAARQCELAGDAMMQMAIERVAEAKERAKDLRAFGAEHAASIERAANFAKENAEAFQTMAQRATAFRHGAGAINQEGGR